MVVLTILCFNVFMYILGINAYHGDSAACLVKDGKLIVALEEERIRRQKHWAGLPTEAIRFCLNYANIKLEDVDYFAVSRDPNANLLNKIVFTLFNFPKIHSVIDRLKNRKKVSGFYQELAKAFGADASKIKNKIRNIEHHRSHLASAFLVSPFEKSAVLSIDGMGDFASAMWGIGEGNEIKIIGQVKYPHSLGFFYTAITQYLGFWKYGDEYKVMGLSAFGKPVYLDKMRRLIKLDKDGGFELDLDYFIHSKKGVKMAWQGGEPAIGKLYSDKLVELLGPSREKEEIINERHKNIAASVQALYEEVFFHILNFIYDKTKSENLCFAGGTAQNSLANGKIFENSKFKEIYIPPAGYDAGTAVGAAFYFYNQILEKPRDFIMNTPFWGPEYNEENLKSQISNFKNKETNLKIRHFENEDGLIKETARLLFEGKIVGWFQGRTEWGPRALGNRSILANPTLPEMKEILNVKIKKREPFRPFAPSVLEENIKDYFEESYPVPFMEKVYVIKPEKRKLIPAVVHIDGTGRLQSVSKKENLKYWKLIKTFGELSGVPILLNTSFNENEPIVNKPEEAINCFLRTKMDILVLGNYLITRI